MPVFRVEKTKDFTVMANHHLKNRSLSLKAKGLLSVILSLPDNWDYTLKGLARINKDGIDAIRQGINELEIAGYIVRGGRSRKDKGQLGGAEYIIYELPQQPTLENPTQADDDAVQPLQDRALHSHPVSPNPTLESPTLDFPTQGNPTQENPIQLNTKEQNTYPEKTHSSNIHPSIHQKRMDRMDVNKCRQKVRQRICYYELTECSPESVAQIDEIVELIVETLCSTKDTIHVAGGEYDASLVKERFEMLQGFHIEQLMDTLKNTASKVSNVKNYLLTALFNAPTSARNGHSLEANHQFFTHNKHNP